MVKVLPMTVTLGNYTNTHNIYLPSDEIIKNPRDLNIKFYNRGKYAYRHNKTPRKDTQIYINNKYFFVINVILNDKTKKTLIDIIRYCYAHGLSIGEIKQEFKIAYGRV